MRIKFIIFLFLTLINIQAFCINETPSCLDECTDDTDCPNTPDKHNTCITHFYDPNCPGIRKCKYKLSDQEKKSEINTALKETDPGKCINECTDDVDCKNTEGYHNTCVTMHNDPKCPSIKKCIKTYF